MLSFLSVGFFFLVAVGSSEEAAVFFVFLVVPPLGALSSETLLSSSAFFVDFFVDVDFFVFEDSIPSPPTTEEASLSPFLLEAFLVLLLAVAFFFVEADD